MPTVFKWACFRMSPTARKCLEYFDHFIVNYQVSTRQSKSPSFPIRSKKAALYPLKLVGKPTHGLGVELGRSYAPASTLAAGGCSFCTEAEQYSLSVRHYTAYS